MDIENHKIKNVKKIKKQNHNIDNQNNILNVKNNLEKTDWSFIKSNDFNYYMELFLNYFIKSYDKSCSEIRHLQNNRIKYKLPWFTKNIKNACKKKQKLYIKFINDKSFENLIRYKKYKNKLTSIIRKCKKNYYTNLLDNSKTITNIMVYIWSILNSIIIPRKPNLLKITININGKDCSGSTISNKINYHFTQIGNKL